jgi:uncharacterized membrane protein YkvA (DUF1232 family)
LEKLKSWARSLKKEILALYLASRHPLTPIHAKVLALAIIAYALSPIDLIPDFIPVLGLLDDLILLPLGIYLVIKMIPPEVMAECRAKATDVRIESIAKWIGAGVIGLIWIFAALVVWRSFSMK